MAVACFNEDQLFRIENIQDKGLGVRASKRLQKGQQVFVVLDLLILKHAFRTGRQPLTTYMSLSYHGVWRAADTRATSH